MKLPSKMDWLSAFVIILILFEVGWFFHLGSFPTDFSLSGYLHWVHENHEDLEAVSAFFTAAFTVVLAVSTIFLWIATSRSAQTAERALTELERPFVFLQDIATSVYPPVTSAGAGTSSYFPSAVFTFHNHGRTPANIAEGRLIIRVLDHIPTDIDEIPAPNMAKPPTRSEVEIYIGAGDSWSTPPFDSWDTVDNAVYTDLYYRRKHLYCWGKIEYRDIFGKTHTTAFCRQYNLTRKEFEPIGGSKKIYAN